MGSQNAIEVRLPRWNGDLLNNKAESNGANVLNLIKLFHSDSTQRVNTHKVIFMWVFRKLRLYAK